MSDESLMKFELRDGVISIGANLTRRDLFTALAMHELFAALAMQGLCANDSTRGASEWVRPIAYCENDRYAQAVLLSRMSGAPHLRERWWLLAHTNGTRLQEPRSESHSTSSPRGQKRYSVEPIFQADIWSQPASVVCRMDDGIRPKTHRLKALGNAVVPLQAREAFKRLAGIGG
jgi:hypothetical protein